MLWKDLKTGPTTLRKLKNKCPRLLIKDFTLKPEEESTLEDEEEEEDVSIGPGVGSTNRSKNKNGSKLEHKPKTPHLPAPRFDLLLDLSPRHN